jgi:hypothetical protein
MLTTILTRSAPADHETDLKQWRNQFALNFQNPLFDQTPEQEIAMKKTALIEIGSKEEVALLLALFGTHGKPVRKPKQKSAH